MPKDRPKILVAALDWGLGHAARCIPVVRALQQQGVVVWLASSGRALALLRSEFPDLPYLELPAYDIRYHKASMVRSIAGQLFKINRAILKEHFMLRRFVRRHDIDAVISDCRFGCFTRRATCIFITHQLHIRTPNPWLSAAVNAFNRWAIRRYDGLWIPDYSEGVNTLAGALSHPVLPGGRYIGLLSRMQRLEVQERYEVVAVLSGPEPQRSLLEKIILEQAKQMDIRLLLVQGKPELLQQERTLTEGDAAITTIPALGAAVLNGVLSSAGVIIARSGYSTMMDLARIGKPAILIPTPGQTEQEYLAEYWSDKGVFSVWEQAHFDFKKALLEAKTRKAPDPALFPEGGLEEAVDGLLKVMSRIKDKG